MSEAELLLVFFISSIMLALAPGPDNLFVLAQAIHKGRAAGLFVTLGLCTGLLLHTAAVALGLAAVITTSDYAYTAIRIAGAGYLLYLALLNFTYSNKSDAHTKLYEPGGWVLYRRGIIMNVTNPKVLIFFLSFLPQFTNPDRGDVVLQTMMLGALFILATLIVFGAISLLADIVSGIAGQSAVLRRSLRYLTGTFFILLAIRVVLD